MRKIISLMLAVVLVCMCVMPVQLVSAAENGILYNTQTTWFPINDETGGNAKYFMAKGSYGLNTGDNFTDFLPMVDYGGISKRYSANDATAAGYTSGVGYYPTGVDDVPEAQLGAFVYTIDASTDNTNNTNQSKYVDLITKNGETFWNINNVDYKIDTNGKAIKLLKNVHTDKIQDSEKAARFATLNGVTFDVTDGYYDSVGFLIGLNSKDKRTFSYKLVYEDGKTGSLTSPEFNNYSTDSSTNYASQGYLRNQKLNSAQEGTTANATDGNNRYVPVVIDTDVTKKLTQIELTAGTNWTVIYIISSWGEKPSFADQLKKVPDAETLTEENVEAAKEALAAFMEYVEACGFTYDDLDADMKAKVDAITTPYAQILANKIARLDENAEITADNIYTYKDTIAEIEEYKTLNSLGYTSQQETKINTIKSNIEAVEYSIILEDINKKISELPAVDTVTVDNFAEVSAKFREINKIIADNGINTEDIAAENQSAMEEMKTKLDEVVIDVTTVIPLDIQDGANAKLFLEGGKEDPEYVEWKDYITGTWFSSVSATTTYNPRAIRYSETGPEAANLIYAPDKIWTMKGIPYRIGSDVLGVRLHGARTVSWNDKIAEIMASYTKAEINLASGYYKKLYVAAINPLATNDDPTANATYTIKYKGGSTQEGTLEIQYSPSVSSYLPSGGYVTVTNIDPNASGTSNVKFDNYVIETDPTKMIDSITFSCSEGSRIIYFAGISGETAPMKTVKEAIESRLSYSIPTVGTATKETLLEIEDLIKEYEAAGGDASGFEGIEKFEEDLAEYYANIIELKETSYDVDFENTYFEATFTKDIELPDNSISVIKGDASLNANEYTLEVDGNKLKIKVSDNHAKAAEYKIRISAGIKNKANTNFYVEEVTEVSFEALKAVAIDKFAVEDGTVNINVSNNMKSKEQSYLLIVAAYDADNKLVGSREVKGALKAGKAIEAALDVSTLGAGVKVECYLADTIDNLKYLDSAATITLQ